MEGLILSMSFFTYSLLPRQGRWTSSVDELNWLQVKNLCQLESEEEQVQIAATMHTVSRWPLAWPAVSGNRIYIYKTESVFQNSGVNRHLKSYCLYYCLFTYINQWPVAKQSVLLHS